jgi:hypothetical protein
MTKRIRNLIAGLTITAAAITGTALATATAAADDRPADSTWQTPADSTWSTPDTVDTAAAPQDSTW